MGGTSTRGNKGHNQRSGGGVRPGFEGGQMPLHRRLPKRGFKNVLAKKVSIVNVTDLDRFEDKAVIDVAALKEIGLIKGGFDKVKVLGNGEVSKSFSLKQCLVSKSAREKIESAGGTIEN
jgi:large subunit ribosomal protein L15